MKIEETWGIAYQRVCEFFSLQQDVLSEESGRFLFRDAVILPEHLPDRKLGSLVLPQTGICITGEDEAVKEIYQRFYFRFLSAGG